MTKSLSRNVFFLFAVFAFFTATLSSSVMAAEKKKTKSAPDVKKALAGELPKASLGGTLDQALSQFGRLVDIPVVVDWATVAATGVKRTTKVSVRVPKKLTAEKLLELLLMRASKKGKPLSWYVSHDVLVVTTQKRVLGLKARKKITASRQKAAKQMSTTVFKKHSFKNEPLKNVIDYYRNATGSNFHVNWKSLENVGIDREEPITLVLNGVSVSRALDMVTNQISEGKDKFESVYWRIDRGVVTISTGHAMNTTNIVTTFEVADLLFAAPNFKGPRLGRSVKGAGNSSSDQGIFEATGTGDGMEKEDAAETREQAKGSLEKIIIDSIGEEMWISGGGKGSVKFFRNKMIISQTLLGYTLLKKAGVLNAFKQIK
ncbi:MAG: hypothetical protein GY794_19345 [bacterium]|nr:hypothetical protein [bacterium]